METKEIVAPKPEVQHLPTLFRQIRNGDIRIPRFQRNFVWTQKQVIELLESVYKGYPIGSILLWRVNEKVFETNPVQGIPFPDVEEKYPTAYVLDGMQRLATLYGVFNLDSDQSNEYFDIVFDLREERFQSRGDAKNSRQVIDLSALFSPKRLMSAQKDLAQQPDGDDLIEKTMFLYSVFQEYLVPLVTIHDRQLSDVVEMFERVNSTGVRLSSVDFLRAVTWSESFDLTHQIERIQSNINELNFAVPQETIVKVLALMLGKDPLPDQMLLLREFSDDALHKAVQGAEDALASTANYLVRDLKIYSSDFVPYEGQVLALAKVFGSAGQDIDEEQLDALWRWYFCIEFNEGLRGRPDHYVARMVHNVRDVVLSKRGDYGLKFSMDPADIVSRRFQRRAALSCGIASMFAVREARSLQTGEYIDPSLYMSEFSNAHFKTLLPASVIRDVFGENLSSARVMSNIFVAPEGEQISSELENITRQISYIYSKNPGAVETQFITEEAMECLGCGDYGGFLMARAKEMSSFASTLVVNDQAGFGRISK